MILWRRFLYVILAFVLLVGAFVAYARLTSKSIDGISCDFSEQTRYHVHAHLTLISHGGKPAYPPANVGIDQLHLCLYWLHTHDASGIVHIEAPRVIRPTLGQFFAVWGRPLTAHDVAGFRPGASGIRAFVDGKRFPGDPARIHLFEHTDVVLEIGAPFVKPPRANFKGY